MEFFKSLSLIQVISIIIVAILLFFAAIQILKIIFQIILKFIEKVLIPVIKIAIVGVIVIGLSTVFSRNVLPMINGTTPASTDTPSSVLAPSTNFNIIEGIQNIIVPIFGTVGAFFGFGLVVLMLWAFSNASSGSTNTPVYIEQEHDRVSEQEKDFEEQNRIREEAYAESKRKEEEYWEQKKKEEDEEKKRKEEEYWYWKEKEQELEDKQKAREEIERQRIAGEEYNRKIFEQWEQQRKEAEEYNKRHYGG